MTQAREYAEPLLNYVAVTGRVVRRHALSMTSIGVRLLEFDIENRIAPYGGSSEEKVSTISVEVWGDLASGIDQRIHKGTMLLIEGTIRSRDYEDHAKAQRHVMVLRAGHVDVLDA